MQPQEPVVRTAATDEGSPSLDPELRVLPSFAELYGQYCVRVFSYCLKRLGHAQDAEDATAQIFTRALAGLPAYRGGSMGAWPFRIAHNTVVGALQARRPELSLQDAQLGLDNRLVSHDEEPVSGLLRAEQRERLQSLIATLRDDQRELLMLRFAAGLTAAEIAAILGMSEGAVRVAIHRAIAQLRQRSAALEENQHG